MKEQINNIEILPEDWTFYNGLGACTLLSAVIVLVAEIAVAL